MPCITLIQAQALDRHKGLKLVRVKAVDEKEVLKILKALKYKKSYGNDGITSEVLKLATEVLVVALAYIINH